MTNKQKKLATNLLIYIPTYNRRKSLNKSLDILIPQISSNKDVTIYISDNCSEQDYDYAISLSKKLSFIIYNKNSANIGGNANIANAFCCPITSNFLWILSDSEIPTKTCIFELKKAFDSDSELYLFSQLKEEKKYIYSYEDNYDLLFKNGVGQISNLVFNRQHFAAYAEAAYFFHNSSFPHLAVLFSQIKIKNECKIKFMNVNKFLNSIPRNSDSDYRLAHIGMPLLAELFSDSYARRFTNSWLINRWYYFFRNKDFLPHTFYATKAILLQGNQPCSYLKFSLLLSFYMILRIFKFDIRDLKRLRSKFFS